MKLVCSKSDLLNGVQIVSKAVPSKTTMSILECILVDASKGMIKLTANDTELGIDTIIDGDIVEKGIVALDAKIFLEIIMPLIVPSIAMICLFVAVGAWNSWFDTYLYASARPKLYSLQYVLMQFLNSSQNQSNSAADANSMAVAAASGSTAAMVTPISLRSSITVIATLPILVVYPFMQKYFIVGMTIGGVKE